MGGSGESGSSVLFCSVLFCSVLFCSVLFCSVLFCSFLFCSVLFFSVLFCSVLFFSVLFYSVCCSSRSFFNTLLYLALSVASASIGQVYRGRIKPSNMLTNAIGEVEASKWVNKRVAIKVQRSTAADSVALDMYLIRRASEWLNKFRGGNIPLLADELGKQLFGELNYNQEAESCELFGKLYRDFSGGRVVVPRACLPLTRKKVMVMEWVDGEKGPWINEFGSEESRNVGLDIVRLGIKCSVSQLLETGFFHGDPHRGNLLKTPDNKLAFIDFGNMYYVTAEERYGLIGLVFGLQNKDLNLITENLLTLGFLEDDAQLDVLIPKLKSAFRNATGGSGKAKDLNFAALQAELDVISRENILKFNTPPFFTIIVRSLTILEGLAISVDPGFRLVKGAYPFVLALLLSREGECPQELKNLLVNLLTVDEGKKINWARLNKFLNLAASSEGPLTPKKTYAMDGAGEYTSYELFGKFLTSDAGLILKEPLIQEIATTIDGLVSKQEQIIYNMSNELLRLPGSMGPVDLTRTAFLEKMLTVVLDNVEKDGLGGFRDVLVDGSRYLTSITKEKNRRKEVNLVIEAAVDVARQVAIEIVQIRAERAINEMF